MVDDNHFKFVEISIAIPRPCFTFVSDVYSDCYNIVEKRKEEIVPSESFVGLFIEISSFVPCVKMDGNDARPKSRTCLLIIEFLLSWSIV